MDAMSNTINSMISYSVLTCLVVFLDPAFLVGAFLEGAFLAGGAATLPPPRL